MPFANLILERRAGWAILTINRPAVRNALDDATWREIARALRELDGEEDVRAVVITGAGEKAFAAGADVRALSQRTMVEALEPGIQGVVTEVAGFSKPLIAAINGYALGGGLELALACDLRVASENARFGLPELNVGIMPGGGGTQRLPRLIGAARAKELIFTGDLIDAAEAYRIGLVNRVVPPEQLLPATEDLVQKIIAKPPLALRLVKQVINQGLATDLAAGLAAEKLAQAYLYGTEDRREGMDAFLQKRAPQWKGK